MKCIHCDEIISLDDAIQHSCFIGKDIFMDSENNLFSESRNTSSISESINMSSNLEHVNVNKQPAVWDKSATLALLSLYEVKKDMLDNPKKKTKIWESISANLQQDFGIQMFVDQVRWKINALTKKYKECVDNNSKSGRNPMTFEWFDQMDEIFGKEKNAIAIHTMSSGFPHMLNSSISSAQKFDSTLTSSASKSSTSKSSTSKSSSTTITVLNDPAVLLENCSNKNVQISTSVSSKTGIRKRQLHGSGSNIARAKIALENQWLEYLNMKAERDKLNDEKHAANFEQKKEALKLKRKHIALKEKEIEQRKDYFTAKLREKENRHAQQIEMEKEKCKLLKKFLKLETSDSE